LRPYPCSKKKKTSLAADAPGSSIGQSPPNSSCHEFSFAPDLIAHATKSQPPTEERRRRAEEVGCGEGSVRRRQVTRSLAGDPGRAPRSTEAASGRPDQHFSTARVEAVPPAGAHARRRRPDSILWQPAASAPLLCLARTAPARENLRWFV
jgi:hypothetical protein